MGSTKQGLGEDKLVLRVKQWKGNTWYRINQRRARSGQIIGAVFKWERSYTKKANCSTESTERQKKGK